MIREARMDDIFRIAEILVFTKRVAYRDIFKDDLASFNELTVKNVVEELKSADLRGVFVYDDGIIKGMMRASFESGRASLEELYVDDFFKRQGIGSLLMAAFLEKAEEAGFREVYCWVLEENRAARAFYEKFSFKPTGNRQLTEGTEITEIEYKKSFLDA